MRSKGKLDRENLGFAKANGLLLCLLVALSLIIKPLFAQTFPEYRVKAAYLLNFARFFEWPDSAFASADQLITVAILGNDPFGKVLEETFKEKTIKGRSLKILRLTAWEPDSSCHILFISSSEKEKVDSILKSVASKPILTVCEVENFALMGGVIEMKMQDQQVVFELNQAAAKKASLVPGLQILKLARVLHR